MCEKCKPEPLDYDEILTTPLDYKIPPIPPTVEDEKKQLMECEASIKISIKQTETKFLLLGENLAYIRDKKLYKHSRYLTFDLYILNTFNMSKSTAYRLIQISEFTKSRTGATFEKYNYSQLLEIVTIPEEDREKLLEKITPDMSKRDIQKLKHNYFTIKLAQQPSSQLVTTTIPETPKPAKTDANITYEDIFNETEKLIEAREIEPLILKNKQERQDFLETYKTWQLIANIDCLKLKIYQRKLKNNSSIVCFETSHFDSNSKLGPYKRYVVVFDVDNKIDYGYRFINSHLNLYFNSENEIIDYLTKNKTQIE